MKFLDFIKNPIGRLLESKINKEVSKRFTASIDREREDRTWRRITDVERKRDLPPIKHDKMIRVVDWLDDRNPQAKKILNLMTDFVVGDGIKYKAEDSDVQRVIDKFWNNNEWDLKQFDRIRELGKYGEQVYNTFVNEKDGNVMLGVFDPEQIDKVVPDPENAEKLDYLKTKSSDKVYEIIKVNRKVKDYNKALVWDGQKVVDDPKKKEIEKRVPDKLYGDVFFFNVNKGSHATRGKSDLLSIADWLDTYDKSLYTMAERMQLLFAFVWDILIEGADEGQLKERQKQLKENPPSPGSYQLHNEREKWEARSPDLRGRDVSDYFKLMATQLTSGSGFPMHWLFGKGEDINRASALEMGEPTYRMLKRRQTYVRYMFQFMFRFQIEQAIDKEILDKDVNRDVALIMPDPSRKEATQIVDTISKLTPSLAIATMNNYIDTDTARQVLLMQLNQLGIDVKPEDMKQKVADDRESVPIYESLKKIMDILNARSKSKVSKKS